jgi:murein DD-endopeptidase MepM/ murein hydrolase activator NlpD
MKKLLIFSLFVGLAGLAILFVRPQRAAALTTSDFRLPYKDSQLFYAAAGPGRYNQPRYYEYKFKIWGDPNYSNPSDYTTEDRPVLAAYRGLVTFSGWYNDPVYGSMGWTIILDHGNGWTSWYSDMKTRRWNGGEDLLQGTYLGTSDSDGIWFSLRYNGSSQPLVGISGIGNTVPQVGRWYRSFQVIPYWVDPIHDKTTVQFPYDFKHPFVDGNNWYVSCGYGCGFHTGSDYYAADWNRKWDEAPGEPALAHGFGTTTFAGWQSGYGYTTVMEDGGGYTTRVAHLQSGGRTGTGYLLKQGTKLGVVGTTGTSSGRHIHAVIYLNGSSIAQTGVSGIYRFLAGSAENYQSRNFYIAPP